MFNFSFGRSRGIPSHLLGSGHFDDNSSDNSTDGKPSDTNAADQCENGDEFKEDKCSSDAGNINNNTDNRYDYLEDNHCGDAGINLNAGHKNLTSSEYEIKFESACDQYDEDDNCRKLSNSKNEILPPPGEPRPENTARLRRYRLNLE